MRMDQEDKRHFAIVLKAMPFYFVVFGAILTFTAYKLGGWEKFWSDMWVILTLDTVCSVVLSLLTAAIRESNYPII